MFIPKLGLANSVPSQCFLVFGNTRQSDFSYYLTLIMEAWFLVLFIIPISIFTRHKGLEHETV